MEEIISIISNVGFPITIACYVIITLNKTLQDNNAILTKLVEKVEVIENKVDKQQ